MIAPLVMIACTRQVSVVDNMAGGWDYSIDSADSGTVPTSDPDPVQGEACEPTTLAPADGDLALSFCTRLSPEPDQVWPSDAGARCGFFNITGAFGIADVASPELLYCDADIEGGYRLGRWDGGVFTSSIVLQENCAAWPGSGSLLPEDDGTSLAAWAGASGDGSLTTARLSAEGRIIGAPTVHDTPTVSKLVVPSGHPRLAVLVDGNQQLWAVPLADDGATSSPAQRLTTGVIDVAAAAGKPGEVVVATCDDDLDLRGVDATTGEELWTGTVRDTGCVPYHRPGIAALPDGTHLVAWDTSDGFAAAALFDPDRSEIERYDLGPGERVVAGPAVAAAASTFLVVATNGTGIVVHPDGAESRRFRHVGIGGHPDVYSLGLTYDGTTAVFAPVRSASMTVGIHQYLYDVIELSSAVVVP